MIQWVSLTSSALSTRSGAIHRSNTVDGWIVDIWPEYALAEIVKNDHACDAMTEVIEFLALCFSDHVG